MAGRWVMSTIQMTFAIQPAIVYWLAGQSFIGHIPIGTVVAFSTLQTRALFPIQSLLGVGADMQASLALFDRIFEYLTCRSTSSKPSIPSPSVRRRPGEVRLQNVSFRYAARGRRGSGWTLRHVNLRCPREPGRRSWGDGFRQDDARLSHRAPVRAEEGQ